MLKIKTMGFCADFCYTSPTEGYSQARPSCRGLERVSSIYSHLTEKERISRGTSNDLGAGRRSDENPASTTQTSRGSPNPGILDHAQG